MYYMGYETNAEFSAKPGLHIVKVNSIDDGSEGWAVVRFVQGGEPVDGLWYCECITHCEAVAWRIASLFGK